MTQLQLNQQQSNNNTVTLAKWLVNGNEYYDAYRAAEAILDNADSSYYDDMLDEVYGDVKIGCGTYYASNVLKEVDPIAYRCGRTDWECSVIEDVQYELEAMEHGEVSDIYGQEVEYCETVIEEAI